MNSFCYSLFITLFLYLQLLYLQNAFAYNASYFPLENIALNCGTYTSELVPYDGRNWTGDADSQYVCSNADARSLIAKAPMTNPSVPEVPYMTARIFQSQFTYRFNVTPGPKFIRLHFYPTSYLGRSVSKAFVSVTVGNFTLLHNFSVSLTADYFNLAYVMKEFTYHVKGRTLELTFTPSFNASDAYAFVNGIEVVSMPSNLYIQGDEAPLPLVGHDPVLYYISNNSALETMHRINVGGDEIPANYDTGIFRTWTTDENYAFPPSTGAKFFDFVMPILYPNTVPAYTAPEGVYRTARAMQPFSDGLINLNYNLSWFFPIDSGFCYLLRLHFCDIFRDITKVNQVVFNIYINNQTAQKGVDIIDMSSGPDVPLYQDFVVMVPEASEGKQDLWIDLYPTVEAKPQYYTAFLNGVEIFKLSNEDGNLARLNPINDKAKPAVQLPHIAPSKNPKKITFIVIGCGLGAVAITLSILSCLIVYRLKVTKPLKLFEL